MPKTRDDLKRTILEKLNVVGVGEIASAEDMQTVDCYIDTRVADLVAAGVINGFEFSAIPETIFDPLANHIASAAAPSYGQASSAEAEAMSEAKMRRHLRPTASTPATPDYF
jgi:hypothetical protein